MNCQQALQWLARYLDGELDAESSGELEGHLAECRECFSLAEFERRLRKIVRQSCEGEQAPPELQERVARLLRRF
jgi:anti-sigma factor (TIGR02949 family)